MVSLRDLLGKGFTGREIRYLLLTAHYRETFNFTLDNLHGARTALARIDECIAKLVEIAGNGPTSSTDVTGILADSTTALDDDLNISAAWAVVFDWVRMLNKRIAENTVSPGDATSALAAWEKVNAVLGIASNAGSEAPPEIVALMDARINARQLKDFKRSDEIRDELKAKGCLVEDSPKGAKLKRI